MFEINQWVVFQEMHQIAVSEYQGFLVDYKHRYTK